MPATVSVSETFVFTSVLLFGTSAGTLTVALDALVISFWSFRRGHAHYKLFFNVCAVPLTLWVAARLYYGLSPYGPLYLYFKPVRIQLLLLPLLAFTIAYYAINTWLITVAIALEKRMSAVKIWKENFVWIALNYFGGASVAALLVSYTHDLDYTFLLIIVPLLVVLYFTFSTSMGRVEDSNRHLSELNRLYMSTIETLAMAIDAKDQITHGHIRRVQVYAVGLAKAMGVTHESQLRAIEAAALLHDMGKLAVPEYILNKPGPLTTAEFEKMKLHASVGADILSAIEFPYPVVPIVRHHHENWDGSGYPDGLFGADIPIGARILSVVDCFDALTSDRPYRPRLANKDALRILEERRGTMYDPLVVDAFLRVHTAIAPQECVAGEKSALRAITAAAVERTDIVENSHARLDEIAASSDEMLTLFDLARSLNGTMDLADSTQLISSHLKRLIPSSLLVLYVYDETADDLVAVHTTGEQAGVINGFRMPVGQRLTGWVAATRQSIRNSDPVLDFGDSARTLVPRLRSSLSTPLIFGTRLVGVLSLYASTKDAFSEEHQRIVEVVATHISGKVFEISSREIRRSASASDSRGCLPDRAHLAEFLRGRQAIEDPSRQISVVLVTAANPLSLPGELSLDRVIEAVRKSIRSGDSIFKLSESSVAVVLVRAERHMADVLRERILENLNACGSQDASVDLYWASEGVESFERMFLAIAPSGTNKNSEAIH
jgi:putative nucleotidyltransferase with HDIG domain